VRRVILGFFVALVISILLTLLTSLLICLGAHPLLLEGMDGTTPALGILAGAYFAARGNWRAGVGGAALFVGLWLVLWLYLQARWNLFRWMTEGFGSLTFAHFAWWAVSLAAGGAGATLSRLPRAYFAAVFAALYAGAVLFAGGSLPKTNQPFTNTPNGEVEEESFGPWPDGTMAWLHTFHFHAKAGLDAGVYDCDSDGPRAYSDANTSYLCEDLAALAHKLNQNLAPGQMQVLCLVNGGFFGASGWSVAHHEESMVENYAIHYRVDLLRPKDQAWFFIMNPPEAVENGHPRFEMTPALPWQDASSWQSFLGSLPENDPRFSLQPAKALKYWSGDKTVLGGVRPLRFAGHSVELKPGAGATTLKCSRTSVGWSEDGNSFYVLTVFDPDGEMASQLQRRSGGPQTGGWDVRQVQKFWGDRDVPYAVLFDGGESTQAAFRRADGSYFLLPSGYQYSFTVGYLRERPLRFTLPILPPCEAHRGVLNYFYVAGPSAH
jgi:hypothetical protein